MGPEFRLLRANFGSVFFLHIQIFPDLLPSACSGGLLGVHPAAGDSALLSIAWSNYLENIVTTVVGRKGMRGGGGGESSFGEQSAKEY